MLKKLNIKNKEHIKEAARLIVQGEIVVSAFNGIFAIIGDGDNREAINKIFIAKNRLPEKTLSLCCSPDFLDKFVDLTKLTPKRAFEIIKKLYSQNLGLGIILRASDNAPVNLVKGDGSILNIWTEYQPYDYLHDLFNEIRRLGKRTMVCTSANKSGETTYTKSSQVIKSFDGDVAAVLDDSFEHISESRRKSTTIIDFTKKIPYLRREGSTSEQEIREQLAEFGLELGVEEESVVRL